VAIINWLSEVYLGLGYIGALTIIYPIPPAKGSRIVPLGALARPSRPGLFRARGRTNSAVPGNRFCPHYLPKGAICTRSSCFGLARVKMATILTRCGSLIGRKRLRNPAFFVSGTILTGFGGFPVSLPCFSLILTAFASNPVRNIRCAAPAGALLSGATTLPPNPRPRGGGLVGASASGNRFFTISGP
jgi:hypothetical protein